MPAKREAHKRKKVKSNKRIEAAVECQKLAAAGIHEGMRVRSVRALKLLSQQPASSSSTVPALSIPKREVAEDAQMDEDMAEPTGPSGGFLISLLRVLLGTPQPPSLHRPQRRPQPTPTRRLSRHRQQKHQLPRSS